MRPILANKLFIPYGSVPRSILNKYNYKLVQYYTDVVIGDDGLAILDSQGRQKLERKEKIHEISGITQLFSGFGNDYIALPRGDISSIYKIVRKSIDLRSIAPLPFKLKLKPETTNDSRWKSYQKTCVDAFLENGSGIILAKTGSGKTVMGIAIAARLGLRTLILAARKDVEPHWVPEFKRHTNITELEKELNKPIIGRFDPNKKEQPFIAVATIQTFLHKKGYSALIENQNTFGLIICDEVHELVSKEFLNVLTKWNPLSWLGLTATLKRNDFREQYAIWYLGNVVAEAQVDQMRPIVSFIRDGFVVPSWLESRIPYSRNWKWNKLHQLLEGDDARMELITNKVMSDIDNGRLVAVVGLRLSIVKKIYDRLIQNGYKAVYVDGKMPKARRDEIYKQVAKGDKYRCICAGKVLKAMVSIDPLDCLHLVTPVNDKTTMHQFFGRTRRPREGKPFPLIRVYVSDGGQLAGAAKNIRKYCEQEGWEIRDENGIPAVNTSPMWMKKRK